MKQWLNLAILSAVTVLAIILLWKLGTVGFIILVLGGLFLLTGGLQALQKKEA